MALRSICLTRCVRLQSERQIVGIRQQELLEDDFIVLEGTLCSPFGTDFEIVAAVVYVLQAVAAAEKYRPEVASLDVSPPGLRGAMLLVEISANYLESENPSFLLRKQRAGIERSTLATCE